VAVTVSCAGASAIGTVEQAARHVKTNRARTWRRTCGCVGRSDSGCVY
jgi:hypothetical protein